MGCQYVVTHTKWSIPGVLLPENIELFAGDRIISDTIYRRPNLGKTTWTVLNVIRNHMDWVYQCEAHYLQLHPRIQQPIQILRPRLVPGTSDLPQDATGSDIYDYQYAYRDEPAAVISQTVDMETFEGQVGGTDHWVVVVTRQLTISSRDKIYVGQVGSGTTPSASCIILDVVDYNEQLLIGDLPHLICKRKMN